MDFQTRRRRNGLAIVPMINLVFLLLIFFLMTAQITPTDLLEVTPPEATSGEAAERLPVVVVDADGRMAFDGVFGTQAVLDRLAATISQHCSTTDCGTDPVALTLRADAAADAQGVARLIGEISAIGPITLTLATVTR